MELRKAIPALPMALSVMLLGACTAAPEPAPQSSAPVELSLATDSAPMYQALAAVYERELENAGFQVSILDPADNALQQVREGAADLAVTAATADLGEPAAVAPESSAGTSPTDALTREQIPDLLTDGQATDAGRIELSPGDLGAVVMMSRAEMALAGIEDFSDLAANCQKVSFAAPPPADRMLHTALEQAQCTEPVSAIEDADPADLLRRGQADAVAMSRASAMIPDEGFIAVPGSAAVFDSAPVITLGAPELPDEAEKVISRTTAALTDETLLAVDRIVRGPQAATPQQVAAHWPWLAQ